MMRKNVTDLVQTIRGCLFDESSFFDLTLECRCLFRLTSSAQQRMEIMHGKVIEDGCIAMENMERSMLG